ncbi:unnamed protein product [Protopolystoma xenopodis]|uniref:Uncharacterized protein n=1 Tax=Protopolystoma xenopodis TaxID=117903 RepID=A0A448XQL7_9PLAT|nr:unnamed protein product [Protopolystoma xenopodis]
MISGPLQFSKVTRSAEECAHTVAQCLPQDLCLNALTPLVNNARHPMNLPAIKMQSRVIRYSPIELVNHVLPDLIPGLIMVNLGYIYPTFTFKEPYVNYLRTNRV